MSIESLLVLSMVIGVTGCILLVLNATWLTRYFAAAASDPAVAAASKLPLILSVAGCILGPAVLVVSPVALVLAFRQQKRIGRENLPRIALVLPRLAAINSVFVFFAVTMLIAWCVGFFMKNGWGGD